ncbi:FkbM family methyltransferase [Runella sp.]|uniref:FkbM family methyltransferase n=1 Tax=Runella sp. TaxID=1960881 RepID=UPI0030189849
MNFKKILVKFYGTRIISFNRYNNLKLDIDFNKDVDFRIYIRKFEDHILFVFQKLLSVDSIVLDIGANIGWYSLIAAQKIKAENHIYAFEPASNAYQKLLKHISLNEASQISAHNCCIADYEGEILLNICEDDAYNSVGNSPILNIQEQVNSPVINIDAFIEKYRIPKVDIIKIDTEGAEMLVLKGAKKTLQKFSPVIFLKLIKKC